MTTRGDIEKVLWSACDTFRGKIDSSRYKDYILTMLFVKYLSDVYKETKENYLEKIEEELEFYLNYDYDSIYEGRAEIE